MPNDWPAGVIAKADQDIAMMRTYIEQMHEWVTSAVAVYPEWDEPVLLINMIAMMKKQCNVDALALMASITILRTWQAEHKS